jgi:hypothetical protein
MKFSEKFKMIWWVCLSSILSCTLIVNFFWKPIIGDDFLEWILILAWTVLIFVPLFSEVDIFGFRIKQEIEKTVGELKEFLISNSNSNTASASTNFYSSPPDSILPFLREELQNALQDVISRLGTDPGQVSNQVENLVEADNRVIYLFTIRFNIEKEIKNIWKSVYHQNPPRKSGIGLLNDLDKSQSLPRSVVDSIRTVYSVVSPGIHGEPITDNQFDLVQELGPRIIKMLTKIAAKEMM